MCIPASLMTQRLPQFVTLGPVKQKQLTGAAAEFVNLIVGGIDDASRSHLSQYLAGTHRRRGHNGYAHGHAFQHNDPELFIPGRQQQNIECGIILLRYERRTFENDITRSVQWMICQFIRTSAGTQDQRF